MLEGGHVFADFVGPVFAPAKAIIDHGVHHEGHSNVTAEIILMAVSLGIAIFGLLVARFMYITSTETPGRIVQRFSGLHKLVYNKYWIDELYDFLFVNSIVEFSKLIWKKFDEAVIDGAVNGVAAVVRAFGSVLRLLQTGLVKDYALSILVGAIVVIGYLLLR